MDVQVVQANYGDPDQAGALIDLLDVYASDPMGGGEPLSAHARETLVSGLAATPQAFSLLAYADDRAVGLANCFVGWSTFAGAPSVNIHDIAVVPDMRGKGIGKALFAGIEAIAVNKGACKVTLEVLSGNAPARALYASLGYGDYVLNPEHGNALFWQKKIIS